MNLNDSIIEADDDNLFVPRPYQADALDSIEENYSDGANRQLVFFATGLGKSSGVMMHLPLRFPHHILDHGMIFLAHRRKILMQAFNDFKAAYPNLWVGLEMGEREATGMEDVVFASVESLGREYQQRITKYRDKKFGVVVADEGHHVKPDGTWDRVLNYFGVGSDEDRHYEIDVQGESVKPLSVFLTATPTRTDDYTLAPFVDAVASEMSITDGIEGGWLTDIKAHRARDEGNVLESEDDQATIDFMVQAYRKYLTGERTLIFASSVDESERFAHNLQDHGLADAAHIDAETPKDERRGIYEAFESEEGEIDALSNRLVLTEGYDNPAITAILDNAPTESKPLHIQKIGRGLRPHPQANVDEQDSAEERKEAIRHSPKPHLTYVATFDPTKHGLDVVAEVADIPEDLDVDGDMVVEEVSDVLERFEEEAPEFEVSEYDSVKEIEISLQRANLLNQTIYNEDLKAMTKLNWIVEGDKAALYMTKNPHATSSKYREAPCVVEFEEHGNGEFSWRIVGGGWNGSFPVENIDYEQTFEAEDLNDCIRKYDNWLKQNEPGAYNWATRLSSEPADENMVSYLERKDVPVDQTQLTKETARLLIDREKIKLKRQDIQ